MLVPQPTLKVYEMTRVDLAIHHFATIETPRLSDLNAVKCSASVEEAIDWYRSGAAGMTQQCLKAEVHNSERLAAFMTNSGDPRPARPEHCHCHAIVSGGHHRAAALRAIMAWCMVRIDDPRNGCWLPSNTAAKPRMPSWLRNAIPHSRIHRKSYYFWLDQVINLQTITSNKDLIEALRMVRLRLQTGNLPSFMRREMNL